MSSVDLNATYRDEDSDTFSEDSLEVNTPQNTKDFLKAPSDNTYQIRGVKCQSNTVQERSHPSKISNRNAVGAFNIKEDEDRLVKRSERYTVKGHACTSKRTSTKSRSVQERCHTSTKPARKMAEAFSIKDDEDTLVKHYASCPVEGRACTSGRVFTQSNSVRETCHTSTIPETKVVEAFCVNEIDDNEMASSVKYPIDNHECLEEWLCTQSSTVDLQERCHTSNIPARKTDVEVFSMNETGDSQIKTVQKYPREGLTSTCTLEWVFAQSKTVQERRRTTDTVPEGNLADTFSITETEDNSTESSKKYPVTVLECTSEWVCTLSSKIGQGLEDTRHTEETFNEIQLPNKKGKKQTKEWEVPFYNRNMTVSEVRKIQKLNRPIPSTKKKSIHVLAGDDKNERTGRLQAQSKGVVERWRHNVKPIYEHSTLVHLATGKDKCNRSAMTTISDAVSKMKIEKSNLRPRRASKSACGVIRSASPALQYTINSQAQKPAQSSKHLPFGYIRKKTSSYLEQYRMEKYGPIYVKRKPPSDGTECSLFDGSTVASLSSELKDKPVNFSSPESSGDEMSFYRKIISGELNPSKADDGEGRSYRNILSDEYDNLRSVSQVDVNANRDSCPRHRSSYVPYSLEDYRTMLQPTRLGRLGPDLESNKEKFERLRKQREYGDLASLKNIQKMQFQKRKFQAQLQLQSQVADSTEPYTNRFSEDDHNTSNNCLSSASHQHESCSYVTSVTANCAPTLSPETQWDRKTTTTKKTKKKTIINAKRKEQQTFTSNKSLIKILQERHMRELEITEKLRQENMM